MDKMDLILVYLRNLMCAEVLIDKGNRGFMSFNGASTSGDFNSQLMIGEIMLIPFLSDLIKRAAGDKELMRLVIERFNRVGSLYICEGGNHWTHRYLTISNGKIRIPYDSLCPAQQESINNFLRQQRDSFEKQRSAFFNNETEGADHYRILLSSTELVELAMSIYSSHRAECLSGDQSRIGVVRFMAQSFGISFPKNYDTLVAQLKERNSATLFLDYLRQALISSLRQKGK